MPPLFNYNQQLDKSELVDYLANQAPRSHKAMVISQGFNPETGDHETFVEHCEQADSTDKISMAKFSASYEDINTIKNKIFSRRLRDVRTAVRNVARTTHFIVASM